MILRPTLLLLIFIGSVIQAAAHEIELSLLSTTDEQFQALDMFVDKPVYIEKIMFNADVYANTQEFFSVTGLSEKSVISCQDLKRACKHLKRKNKFDTLVLTLSKPMDAGGATLTFTLKASWTFLKVSFKGSLVGKDRYSHYYALEGGEVFDVAKHQQSLVKIQQELKNQGYLEARVTDAIFYDKETKTVTVTLYADKTEQFTISDLSVVVSCKQNTAQEIKKLQEKITALIKLELIGAHCKQQLLQEQTDRITLYLGRKGFLNSKVDPLITAHAQKRIVRVKYAVMLSEYKRFIFSGNNFFTRNI